MLFFPRDKSNPTRISFCLSNCKQKVKPLKVLHKVNKLYIQPV